MLWPETNRKVSQVFEGGILPTMVYINRQNYERQMMERPLHRHRSICEMILVYKGSGYYHYNKNQYSCCEGSVALYNQGDLHEMVSGSDSEIGTYCIGIANLHKKGLPENCLLAPGESCVRPSGKFFSLMESMCEQMYAMEDRGPESGLAVQLLCASLIVLAGQLEEDARGKGAPEKEEDMVQRIRRYMDYHFTEHITLADTASALGCSETYISHLYKKATGQTPMQYVIRRRVGLAQTLLISTDLSVTEIAARVGYDNTNYFSTMFSRKIGMSPVHYRKFYKTESKGLNSQI